MLTQEIAEVRKTLNTHLRVLGVLITNFDRRIRVQKDVVQQIKQVFGKEAFDTEIGVNAPIQTAQSQYKTIYEFAQSERGATDYMALAKEVLERVEV